MLSEEESVKPGSARTAEKTRFVGPRRYASATCAEAAEYTGFLGRYQAIEHTSMSICVAFAIGAPDVVESRDVGICLGICKRTLPVQE